MTKDDNFGFCKWVDAHLDELRGLGAGTHFGEWWGLGIQRGYGLKENRFSLFNTTEGVVVFHIAGNVAFKKTIVKDEERKGKNE